mgnify:CR=1 FL=1
MVVQVFSMCGAASVTSMISLGSACSTVIGRLVAINRPRRSRIWPRSVVPASGTGLTLAASVAVASVTMRTPMVMNTASAMKQLATSRKPNQKPDHKPQENVKKQQKNTLFLHYGVWVPLTSHHFFAEDFYKIPL